MTFSFSQVHHQIDQNVKLMYNNNENWSYFVSDILNLGKSLKIISLFPQNLGVQRRPFFVLWASQDAWTPFWLKACTHLKFFNFFLVRFDSLDVMQEWSIRFATTTRTNRPHCYISDFRTEYVIYDKRTMVAYLPKLENALFLSWGGVSSDSEEACDFFRLFVSSEMDTVASWKNHWIVLITHYCMDL